MVSAGRARIRDYFRGGFLAGQQRPVRQGDKQSAAWRRRAMMDGLLTSPQKAGDIGVSTGQYILSSVSLPRDRFWDTQVSKIDSPTRQPLLPRPSCVRAASPHLRKLGAGYAALPQMTGRDFSYAYFVSPLRYRTPDKQCGPGRYRGLTAFASLSMAVSERQATVADDIGAGLFDDETFHCFTCWVMFHKPTF
ncbi:hypothetical protein [Thiolapillus sp.]|uniref:hypothetical protein n=2 Tax=Thiolapillus sp. TaxID=2017437 RepID=UPI003AF9C672